MTMPLSNKNAVFLMELTKGDVVNSGKNNEVIVFPDSSKINQMGKPDEVSWEKLKNLR